MSSAANEFSAPPPESYDQLIVPEAGRAQQVAKESGLTDEDLIDRTIKKGTLVENGEGGFTFVYDDPLLVDTYTVHIGLNRGGGYVLKGATRQA